MGRGYWESAPNDRPLSILSIYKIYDSESDFRPHNTTLRTHNIYKINVIIDLAIHRPRFNGPQPRRFDYQRRRYNERLTFPVGRGTMTRWPLSSEVVTNVYIKPWQYVVPVCILWIDFEFGDCSRLRHRLTLCRPKSRLPVVMSAKVVWFFRFSSLLFSQNLLKIV